MFLLTIKPPSCFLVSPAWHAREWPQILSQHPLQHLLQQLHRTERKRRKFYHQKTISLPLPTLNWKVTEWVPKLASNWVLILTAGGLPVAFCTTRNSLVTISMTWPVWKTKSPFLLTASEERQPGMLGWLLSSRVGEDWKALCEDWIVTQKFCLTARTWNTAMSSKNGLKDNLNISAAGTLQLR